MLCDQAHCGIVAGVGEPTANSPRRKASSVGVGAGPGGFDLCTNEHGFHGNLSSESGIVGEVPESAISQRCKKRPHGCRTPGANGSTKSRPLSSLGSWSRANAKFATAGRGSPKAGRGY